MTAPLRQCRNCKQALPLADFYTRTRGTPYAFCKVCHDAGVAEWRKREDAWRADMAREAMRKVRASGWLQCSLERHHKAAPGPIPSLTCARCGSLLTAPAHGFWPRRLSAWGAQP